MIEGTRRYAPGSFFADGPGRAKYDQSDRTGDCLLDTFGRSALPLAREGFF